jgi:adenylate cyclase
VRRADHRVRINAELASGATGKVLWAERYERDLDASSVFEIQDDIAVHVVATIAQSDGAILLPERVLVRRKPVERLDTYECLLVFYDYASDLGPARHARAVEALERAHQMEPDSSAIWAALAHVYLDRYRFGFNVVGNPVEALKAGLRAAQTAVDLDPLNPSAYHALFAARYAHGDRKGFREAAARAVELNPINTDILASYGLHLILSDEFELGQVVMNLALALNPEPPDGYWFAFYSLHSARGEHEEALEMALRVQTEDFYWTHCMRAASYALVGMKAEAAESIRALLALYPDFAQHAAEEVGRWTSPARVERAVDALHKAGLPNP